MGTYQRKVKKITEDPANGLTLKGSVTGVIVGEVGDKVGMYGCANTQRASANQAALTAPTLATVGTLVGFSSTSALTSLYAFCNEIRNVLISTTGIGAMKGSA